MSKRRKAPSAQPVQPAFSEQSVVVLRKQVRIVLSALPAGRRASLAVLRASLEALGFAFTDLELRAAVEWNHARNYVDFVTNDYETDEWFLTEKGARA
jgi:hypothetical protein